MANEENDTLNLIERILGKEGVTHGKNYEVVPHVRWESPSGFNERGYMTHETVCTSYCARCLLTARILNEMEKRS